MNFGGSMPDWHQYNPVQSVGPEASPVGQNVNPGSIYGSSISPRSLNGSNISPEGLSKAQSDTNYSPRTFQQSPGTLNGPNGPEHSPLVQMAGCVGHYGTSSPRNPMMDCLNGPLDARNGLIGSANEPMPHRGNQMPINGPMGHLNAPSINGLNSPLGHMATRNPPMPPMPPGRQAPSPYVPCKGPCCSQDPNLGYQNWEKFGPYTPNMSYRENMGPSGYTVDNRRYNSDFNVRKDGYETKEPLGSSPYNIDPRRNFPDYKYRKDTMIPRGYAPPPGVPQSYPVQSYNFPGEYQKYPAYPRKDYPRESSVSSVQNPSVLKYHEQSVIVQQRYTTKQIQYPNGMIPKGVIPTNMGTSIISRAQNPYFNPQLTRDFPRDYSEGSSLANRGMQTTTPSPAHGSYPKYQMYQQKIAMQRFTMENNLRELTRIPGYQSHPKYQECLLRYNELLRLQKTVEYQSNVPEAVRVVAPQVNEDIPPINLQFDQNGVLINTSFAPSGFSGSQNPANSQHLESMQNLSSSEHLQHPERFHSQERAANRLQSQESPNLRQAELTRDNQARYSIQKDYSQEQFHIQRYESESYEALNTDKRETMHHRNSRDFADKPELDVRQFLANWDESEEEDGADENLPGVAASNSTSIVVVEEYEDTEIVPGTDEGDESCQRTGDRHGTEDCGELENSPKETDSTKADKAQAFPTDVESTGCSERSPEDSSSTEAVAKTGSVIQCTDQATKVASNPECDEEVEKKSRNVFGEMETRDSEMNEEATNDRDLSKSPPSNAEETISSIKEHIESYNQEDSAGARSADNEIISNDDKSSSEGPGKESSDDLKDTFGSNESLSGSEGANSKKASENSTYKKSPARIQGTEIHVDAHELSNLPMSLKNHSGPTENPNLRKQSSFASEESHNPDDISLPDLPTSECTPISTTLNTPIHSDSEESSGHVIDLTIPTNPIEIIQNSPMLSFTHSPIKMEPYEHLEEDDSMEKRSRGSLDFDFEGSERCKAYYEKRDDETPRADEDYESTTDEDDNSSKCDSIRSSKSYLKRDAGGMKVDDDDDDDGKPLVADKRNVTLKNEVNGNVADSNDQPWLSIASMEGKQQISDRNELSNEAENDVINSEASPDTKESSEISRSSESEDSEDIENEVSASNEVKPLYERENEKCSSSGSRVVSDWTTDDGMKLDSSESVPKGTDSQLEAKGDEDRLNENVAMNLARSDHDEICCSPIEDTGMFHTSPEHEKLYTTSMEQDKIYAQSIESQSNFAGTSSIIPLIPGEDFEEPKIPVPPMEGNCLTKIIKNTSPITNLDVLGSDDEKLDKMDDIWMDVGCVETVVKPADVNLETFSECRKSSTHPGSNFFSKKFRKVQKTCWKQGKNATKGKYARNSIAKILKARKEKLDSTTEVSTSADATKIPKEGFQSAVIKGAEKIAEEASRSVFSGMLNCSGKSFAQDSNTANENVNRGSASLRVNSPVELSRSQEKGNQINDIATKLLENARLFEPEHRRMEVLRKESSSCESSKDLSSSKERIKLLKEFRKVKNKPNQTTVVETDDKSSFHLSDKNPNDESSSMKFQSLRKDTAEESTGISKPRGIEENISLRIERPLEDVGQTDLAKQSFPSVIKMKGIESNDRSSFSTTDKPLVFSENQKGIRSTSEATNTEKEDDPGLEIETSKSEESKVVGSTLIAPNENVAEVDLPQSEMAQEKSHKTDCRTMKKHDVSTPLKAGKHISYTSEGNVVIPMEADDENTSIVETGKNLGNVSDDSTSVPDEVSNVNSEIRNCYEEPKDNGSMLDMTKDDTKDCETLKDNSGGLENTLRAVEVFDPIDNRENSANGSVSEERRDISESRPEETSESLEAPKEELVPKVDSDNEFKKPLNDDGEKPTEQSEILLTNDNLSKSHMLEENAGEESKESRDNDEEKSSASCLTAENAKTLNVSCNLETTQAIESLEVHESSENCAVIGEELIQKQSSEVIKHPETKPANSVDPLETAEAATNVSSINSPEKIDETKQSIAIAKEEVIVKNVTVSLETDSEPKTTFEGPEDTEKSIVPRKILEPNPQRHSANVSESIVNKSLDEIEASLETLRSPKAGDVSFETFGLDSSFNFDFNNFDVAPNESETLDQNETDGWKYSKAYSRFEDCERYKNPDSYVNPIFTSLDTLENLNTVPVYTTKDGKVTYSPNPKFTYRALIMEARRREGYPSVMRDTYYVNPRAPDDYNNYSKPPITYRKRKYSEGLVHGNASGCIKRNYLEYFEPRGHQMIASSPKTFNEPRHNKNHYNKYYHLGRERVHSNLPQNNFPGDRKHNQATTLAQGNLTNRHSTREEYIALEEYNRRKNGTVDLNKYCKKPQSAEDQQPVDARRPRNKCNNNLEIAKSGTSVSHGNKTRQWEETVAKDKHLPKAIKESHLKRNSLSKSSAKAEPSTSHDYDGSKKKNCQGVIDAAIAEKVPLEEANCEDGSSEASRKEYTKKVMKSSNVLIGLLTSDWENVESYENFVLQQKKMEEQTSTRKLSDSELRIVYAEQMKLVNDYSFDKDDEVNDCKSSGVKEEGKCNSSNESGIVHPDEGIKEDKQSRSEETQSTIPEENKELCEINLSETQILDEDGSKRKEDAPSKKDLMEGSSLKTLVDITKLDNVGKSCLEINELDEGTKGKSLLNEQEFNADQNEMKISEDCNEGKNNLSDCETNFPKDIDPSGLQEEEVEALAEDEHPMEKLEENLLNVQQEELETDDKNMISIEDSSSLQKDEEASVQVGTDNNDNKDSEENTSCHLQITDQDLLSKNAKYTQEENCSTKDENLESKKDGLANFPGQKIDAHNLLEKEELLNKTTSKLQTQFEKYTAYSPPNDGFDENKIVPKLVIKKTDALNLKNTSLKPSPYSSTENLSDREESNSRVTSYPKIPKMIIRNARSRPSTPSIEEIPEESSTSSKATKEEHKVFKLKIKLEEKGDRSRPVTPSTEIVSKANVIENKVPKMKIKLEDKLPKVIIKTLATNDSAGSKDGKKTIPKMKIEKVRSAQPKIVDLQVLPLPLPKVATCKRSRMAGDNLESLAPNADQPIGNIVKDNESAAAEKIEDKREKIPKLKIKRQSSSSSIESTRKRQSSSPLRTEYKKVRKSGKGGETIDKKQSHKLKLVSDCLPEDARKSEKHPEATERSSSEPDDKFKADPSVSSGIVSEKIPKVIIKRISPSSEFKCELSKGKKDAIIKNNKWQPEVRLQRSWVLDCMAKDLRLDRLILKLATPDSLARKSSTERRKPGPKRSHLREEDPNNLAKTGGSVSNAAADMKARRLSDFDVMRLEDTDSLLMPKTTNARKRCKSDMSQSFSKCRENLEKMKVTRCSKDPNEKGTTLFETDENVGDTDILQNKSNEGKLMFNDYYERMKTLKQSYGRPGLVETKAKSKDPIGTRCKALDENMNSKNDIVMEAIKLDDLILTPGGSENMPIVDFPTDLVSYETSLEATGSENDSWNDSVFGIDNSKEYYEHYDASASDFTTDTSFEIVDTEIEGDLVIRSHQLMNPKDNCLVSIDRNSEDEPILNDCTDASVRNMLDPGREKNKIDKLMVSLPMDAVNHCEVVGNFNGTIDDPVVREEIILMEPRAIVVQAGNNKTGIRNKGHFDETAVNAKESSNEAATNLESLKSYEESKTERFTIGERDEAAAIGNIDFGIKDSPVDMKCGNLTEDSGIGNENNAPDLTVANSEGPSRTRGNYQIANLNLDNSVIKVDSSDESQTTIEILTASDLSQSQSEMEMSHCLENREDTRVCLYSEDAIPTQFELELELAESNTPDPLEVPIPEAEEAVEDNRNGDELLGGNDCSILYCFANKSTDDSNLANGTISAEILTNEDNSTCGVQERSATISHRLEKSFCCSDLLVKEVLAAKEALRKCLSKTKNDSRTRYKTRPKTAAEKKQGSSFDLSTLQCSDKLFPELGNCYSNDSTIPDENSKWEGARDRVGVTNNQRKTENINTEKSERRHSKSDKSYSMGRKLKSAKIEDATGLIRMEGRTISRHDSANARGTLESTQDVMTISLKDSKRLIKSILNSKSSKSAPETINSKDTKYKSKSPRHHVELESVRKPKNSLPDATSPGSKIEVDHHRDKPLDRTENSVTSKEDIPKYKTSKCSQDVGRITEKAISIKSYRIPKISKSKASSNDKSREAGGEVRTKEDKMPVLEPEIDLNGDGFEDFGLNCDQETTRSPPVITNQETDRVEEEANENVGSIEEFFTKGASKVPEEEEVEARVPHQGKETTVADIVNELAYHEKATIRHRRYCTLCERWFPTVARHRRHLTGYQHRHTELTQRRTVHALFALFTGRPCPRLQPAEVVRTDCTPGEPTPLQIAVQDVTKEFNESDGNAAKQIKKEGDK